MTWLMSETGQRPDTRAGFAGPAGGLAVALPGSPVGTAGYVEFA